MPCDYIYRKTGNAICCDRKQPVYGELIPLICRVAICRENRDIMS